MHLSPSSCRVASHILVLLFLSGLSTTPFYQGTLATSCGQPRQSNEDKCTNWQCSRILQNSTNWPQQDKYGICVRGLTEGVECKVDNDCFIEEGLKCVQYVDKNNATQSRCKKVGSNKNAAVGYVAMVITCLAFGSLFVPTKKVKTGSGILFQFIMCGSLLVIGICISLVTDRYIVYPRSMLGGMVWAIANAMAPPIINMIGIGLHMTLLMGIKLLSGWASGRFGLLGVKAVVPKIPWLAYFGIFIGIVAVVLFLFVKPNLNKKKDKTSPVNNTANQQTVSDDPQDVAMKDSNEKENEPATGPEDVAMKVSNETGNDPVIDLQDVVTKDSNDKPRNPLYVRIFGCVLAIFSGILYGINFNPSQSMMDHYVELTLNDNISPVSIQYSRIGLDYVFSATLGIFMTSVFITVPFYAIRTYLPLRWRDKLPQEIFGDEKNSDVVEVEKMLCPAFLCGVLWITGQTAWFVANTNLPMIVTFPIITLGCCIVVNIWAIFVFREIRGMKNFIILAAGFLCVLATCLCTVFANL